MITVFGLSSATDQQRAVAAADNVKTRSKPI